MNEAGQDLVNYKVVVTKEPVVEELNQGSKKDQGLTSSQQQM